MLDFFWYSRIFSRNQKIELYSKQSQVGESAFTKKVEEKEETEHKPQLITQSQVEENKENIEINTVEEVEETFPEVSETEKMSIKNSDQFSSFVDKASITMERALFASSKYDILVDYALGSEDTDAM